MRKQLLWQPLCFWDGWQHISAFLCEVADINPLMKDVVFSPLCKYMMTVIFTWQFHSYIRSLFTWPNLPLGVSINFISHINPSCTPQLSLSDNISCLLWIGSANSSKYKQSQQGAATEIDCYFKWHLSHAKPQNESAYIFWVLSSPILLWKPTIYFYPDLHAKNRASQTQNACLSSKV